MSNKATSTLVAENTWTDAVNARAARLVTVSVTDGTATLCTVQRMGADDNWADIETLTSPFEKEYRNGAPRQMRVGVATGDYTDSVTVSIEVGNRAG